MADGLGLDDVVAAVDLGQVLAFGGTCLGALESVLVDIQGIFRGFKGDFTYNVTGGVLLLSENATGALGGVQGTLALDNGLAGLSASSAELAADLGGAFPVRHFEWRLFLVVWVVEVGENDSRAWKEMTLVV